MALLAVIAITGIVAGIDFMIYSDGLLFGLHPVLLEHTPFSTFFVPGLISLLVVGGSGLASLLLLKDKSKYALPVSLFSGFAVVMCTSLASFIFRNIYWAEIIYWLVGANIILQALYMQAKYDNLEIAESAKAPQLR
jgi:hypothetical protein